MTSEIKRAQKGDKIRFALRYGSAAAEVISRWGPNAVRVKDLRDYRTRIIRDVDVVYINGALTGNQAEDD